MNPETPHTVPADAKRERRFPRLRIYVAGICVLLASILLVVSLAAPPVGSVVWLTPSERDRLNKPGALAQLKWRIKTLAGPVLYRFWKGQGQPVVRIESQFITLPPAEVRSFQLPGPVTTNAAGERAWVLSPSDLGAFRQRLLETPGAILLGSPMLHTVNGGRVHLFSGSEIPVAGKPVRIGLTVDVDPRVSGSSVMLIVGATSTETETVTNANLTLPTVRTNFAINYQSWLRNQSGLVVYGGDARDSKGNGYCFILVPTIIHPSGSTGTK